MSLETNPHVTRTQSLQHPSWSPIMASLYPWIHTHTQIVTSLVNVFVMATKAKRVLAVHCHAVLSRCTITSMPGVNQQDNIMCVCFALTSKIC